MKRKKYIKPSSYTIWVTLGNMINCSCIHCKATSTGNATDCGCGCKGYVDPKSSSASKNFIDFDDFADENY